MIDWADIGKKTRQLRAMAGLTQEEVAFKARTSQATVSRLEGGKQEGMTVDTLEGLVKAAGGDLQVLVVPPGYQAPWGSED